MRCTVLDSGAYTHTQGEIKGGGGISMDMQCNLMKYISIQFLKKIKLKKCCAFHSTSFSNARSF